jgi:cell division protein FtsB
VKKHLHGGPPDSLDAEALKKEVEELRQKNKDLEEQVAQLQAAVGGIPVSYILDCHEV